MRFEHVVVLGLTRGFVRGSGAVVEGGLVWVCAGAGGGQMMVGGYLPGQGLCGGDWSRLLSLAGVRDGWGCGGGVKCQERSLVDKQRPRPGAVTAVRSGGGQVVGRCCGVGVEPWYVGLSLRQIRGVWRRAFVGDGGRASHAGRQPCSTVQRGFAGPQRAPSVAAVNEAFGGRGLR